MTLVHLVCWYWHEKTSDCLPAVSNVIGPLSMVRTVAARDAWNGWVDLSDPDLLVLDEATSAVDPATEVRISRTLGNLTEGRTVITIAHRLSTAEAADRVLVFDLGRVVQDGPHRRLVGEPGPYRHLHDAWERGAINHPARSG